ncbi:MAG: FeoA domain-containing protein [Longicatena sp.]
MKLTALKDGEKAIIKEIKLNKKDQQRLFYMGFYIGAKIEKIRQAPCGDPKLFFLAGNQIILRKKECMKIEVDII